MKANQPGTYGHRVGPQRRRHYPHYTRGCYYGPYTGRAKPCLRCRYGRLGIGIYAVQHVATTLLGAVGWLLLVLLYGWLRFWAFVIPDRWQPTGGQP